MGKTKKVTKTVTTTTTVTEEVIEKKVIETHYLLILDKSGSMSSVRDVTISGLNEQIQTIKKLEKQFPDQKYYISLITFDNTVQENFLNKPSSELNEMEQKDYVPSGMTALLDAMGHGITRLEDKLRPEMDSKDKIVTAVVVVMTDGYENASKKWSNKQVKELVERLNKDNHWDISFIGASKDAFLTGQDYGIKNGNIAFYTASAAGTSTLNSTIAASFYNRGVTMNNASTDLKNLFSYSDIQNGEIKEVNDTQSSADKS